MYKHVQDKKGAGFVQDTEKNKYVLQSKIGIYYKAIRARHSKPLRLLGFSNLCLEQHECLLGISS